jgi:hypothetical protein
MRTREGAEELLVWLMRWTAAQLISLFTRGRGAAELLGWLVRWGTIEERFVLLVWVGWLVGRLLIGWVGTIRGMSLRSVLSTNVQSGLGGFWFLLEGNLFVVVSGQEELAIFLHSAM